MESTSAASSGLFNHDILDIMAIEEEEVKTEACPLCGLVVPVNELRECTICRSFSCDYCAIIGFGREFCSRRCRDFFFWGDGEHDEKDF